MTEELLEKARTAQKNIQDIRTTLNSIERIKLLGNNNNMRYKPYLKFLNMLKRKDGKDVREATVAVFDGLGTYGTEIVFDERLLDCLKEHYQERLEEAKAVLDAM